MEKEAFIQILHKYLQGDSTVEEDELLISYYNLFEGEPDVVALLTPQKKEAIKDAIFLGIQQRINRHENKPKLVRTLYTRWAAAAAVLLIAGMSLLYLLRPAGGAGRQQVAQAINKKQHHVYHLPDGSLVIVSHGSRLRLSADFKTAATRDIYLEGEAYFDIRHDASRPFIVHTQEVATTVLGTAFNIKALKADERVMVTVSRGKVRVSEKDVTLDLLTPDEQIVVNRSNGNAVKTTVKAADFVRWKNQEDLLLDNVTFRETALLLEERFGVSITFRDKALENERFTTVLMKRESLEQVIKTICEFNSATWSYEKNKSSLLISNKE